MKFIVATCLILILIISMYKYRVFTVVSGSMEPIIKNGSLVIVKKTSTYKTNDLVTFKNIEGTGTVTHRIVKIEQSQGKYLIFTKGDGNANVDQVAIKPEDIIGKVVFTLPLAGKFFLLVSSQKLLPITFYIPAGLLFGTLLGKHKRDI
ncbi:signal peptidase I [Patescibacteria group bacterium]|nr:signal peptidase I [Patescibacteria group bacterium]MBU1953103.1 signal peptidase I [Patescibacteria group bacterium]